MNLINFVLDNPTAQLVILLIKILGTLFFVVGAVVAFFVLRASNFMKMAFTQDLYELRHQRAYGVAEIARKWASLQKRLQSDNAADWKLAIIEAENVLDEVLARLGFAGETLGERLKRINRDQLPSREDLVKAHEIRNNIIHDPDYLLNLEETNQAIGVYGRCLQELNAL